MLDMPHDTRDLYLAPVSLHLDAELQKLVGMGESELLMHLTLRTGREPRSVADRRVLFLETMARGAELHGWELAVDPRGLELTHGEHRVVLGLPAGVREFLGA